MDLKLIRVQPRPFLIIAIFYFHYTTFADDCSISFVVKQNKLNISHRDINANLQHLVTWINSNKLRVNVDKTKYMIYSYRGQMGNDIVEQVNCVRFLGIMLDDRLNCCNHVCLISDKISKGIGLVILFH